MQRQQREDARRLEDGRRAGTIVVGTRRIFDRVGTRRVARIEVTRHDVGAIPWFITMQRRDDARYLDVARNAFAVGRLQVRVERDGHALTRMPGDRAERAGDPAEAPSA
jgi:hypothetical protein